jgi:hypothetical protein
MTLAEFLSLVDVRTLSRHMVHSTRYCSCSRTNYGRNSSPQSIKLRLMDLPMRPGSLFTCAIYSLDTNEVSLALPASLVILALPLLVATSQSCFTKVTMTRLCRANHRRVVVKHLLWQQLAVHRRGMRNGFSLLLSHWQDGCPFPPPRHILVAH